MKKISIFVLLAVMWLEILCPAFAVAAEGENVFSGLTLGGGITFILQHAQHANVSEDKNGIPFDNSKTPTVASYSIDLTLEKNFDENSRAFFHLETGEGSLDSHLDVFAGVNRDSDISDGSINLTEAYFEHTFENGWIVTGGKLDPTVYLDENAFANDETTQFLSYAFRNASTVDFPDNTLGARIGWQKGLIEANVQYLDASERDHDDGDVLKHAFTSAQLNIKPGFMADLEGNYRFYGWTNTNNYIHESGHEKTKYGWGISFDQQLSDVLGVFARWSWARGGILKGTLNTGPNGTFGLSHTWSAGLQWSVSWLGQQDILGLGIGQVKASKTSVNAGFGGAKTENHAEIYYAWKVADYLVLTSDVQIIQNPHGDNGEKTIYAGALRTQINF